MPAAQDGVGVPRRTAIFDARNVLTSAETITAEFFAPAISAGVRLGSGDGGEVPGAARRAGIRILRELCIVEMVDVHVAQQNGMDVAEPANRASGVVEDPHARRILEEQRSVAGAELLRLGTERSDADRLRQGDGGREEKHGGRSGSSRNDHGRPLRKSRHCLARGASRPSSAKGRREGVVPGCRVGSNAPCGVTAGDGSEAQPF